MEEKIVLSDLSEGKMTPQEAYDALFIKEKVRKPNLFNRAHFIKMDIHTDDNTANKVLKVLFAVPIPIVLLRVGLIGARIFSKFISKKADFSDKLDDSVEFDQKELMKELIKIADKFVMYSKGTMIQVDSEDAKVDIKIV